MRGQPQQVAVLVDYFLGKSIHSTNIRIGYLSQLLGQMLAEFLLLRLLEH